MDEKRERTRMRKDQPACYDCLLACHSLIKRLPGRTCAGLGSQGLMRLQWSLLVADQSGLCFLSKAKMCPNAEQIPQSSMMVSGSSKSLQIENELFKVLDLSLSQRIFDLRNPNAVIVSNAASFLRSLIEANRNSLSLVPFHHCSRHGLFLSTLVPEQRSFCLG